MIVFSFVDSVSIGPKEKVSVVCNRLLEVCQECEGGSVKWLNIMISCYVKMNEVPKGNLLMFKQAWIQPKSL